MNSRLRNIFAMLTCFQKILYEPSSPRSWWTSIGELTCKQLLRSSFKETSNVLTSFKKRLLHCRQSLQKWLSSLSLSSIIQCKSWSISTWLKMSSLFLSTKEWYMDRLQIFHRCNPSWLVRSIWTYYKSCLTDKRIRQRSSTTRRSRATLTGNSSSSFLPMRWISPHSRRSKLSLADRRISSSSSSSLPIPKRWLEPISHSVRSTQSRTKKGRKRLRSLIRLATSW